MTTKNNSHRTIRWLSSVALVVAGLSLTWAWGQVARLAEPQQVEAEPAPPAVYAVWQPADPRAAVLFRSTDQGATWQSLALPSGAPPRTWAYDGGERLAVEAGDGSLFISHDRGESWDMVSAELPILSLAWGESGDLYLGTDGLGVYRLPSGGVLIPISDPQVELASLPVLHLAEVEGRLFAATPAFVFHADNAAGASALSPARWTRSQPVPEGITALAAADRETVYVGTQIVGILRSVDAGQSWEPASEGLGMAAGQMVNIAALRADPDLPGVLYASVVHVLGSTQVHSSAAGTFVTLDGGARWQPLAGPAFPQASSAADLVLVTGDPLHVRAVTEAGFQDYMPDVAGALAALKDPDAQLRVAAARMLGLSRAMEAGDSLLAALADPDPAVSMAAADALGRINDPALAGSLLVVLQHPDEQIRLNAARILGVMGIEAAVQPLRSMLLNDRGAAIKVAADALGQIGGAEATDALLTALSDPPGTSRWHAALAALEKMGEPAVGPLAERLHSEQVYPRRNAAEALGWIGSPSATAALIAGLEDENALVREQAAWALGEIADPAARAALEKVQSGDSSFSVQAAASAALVRIKDTPDRASRWPATWAPALQRLQAVRWSILALSLAGAGWLAASRKILSLLPEPQTGVR
jgi:HEAT repeat protein